MKSRWCSYRKQCSGFCSCPDSNWPPRYSYHGNVVYLFACSIIIAYSKIPLFCLPTLQFILFISSLPLFSHWVALLFRTKVPSHVNLVMPNPACCGFSKFAPASFLAKYGHSVSCGDFNTLFYWAAHTKVSFLLHRCSVTVTDKLVLRLDYLCAVCMHIIVCISQSTCYILPKRIITWFWNKFLSIGFVLWIILTESLVWQISIYN